MTTSPAGWYDDPSDPLRERLWDGTGWVEHVRPKPPRTDAGGTEKYPQMDGSVDHVSVLSQPTGLGRGGRLGKVLSLGLIVVGLLLAGALLVVSGADVRTLRGAVKLAPLLFALGTLASLRLPRGALVREHLGRINKVQTVYKFKLASNGFSYGLPGNKGGLLLVRRRLTRPPSGLPRITFYGPFKADELKTALSRLEHGLSQNVHYELPEVEKGHPRPIR